MEVLAYLQAALLGYSLDQAEVGAIVGVGDPRRGEKVKGGSRCEKEELKQALPPPRGRLYGDAGFAVILSGAKNLRKPPGAARSLSPAP